MTKMSKCRLRPLSNIFFKTSVNPRLFSVTVLTTSKAFNYCTVLWYHYTILNTLCFVPVLLKYIQPLFLPYRGAFILTGMNLHLTR